MYHSLVLGFLTVLIFAGIIWTIGTATLVVLNKYKGYCWLSFPIGLMFVYIVVNYCFFAFEKQTTQIQLVILFLFGLSVICLIFHGIEFATITPVLFIVVVYTILVIPSLIGGRAYFVSGTGYWDDYSYLSLALLYDKFGLKAIQEMSTIDMAMINDVCADVLFMYGMRPSSPLLFSVIISRTPGDLFALAYGYNCLMLAISATPIIWFCYKINPRINRLIAILCGGAYVFGFYGQSILDMRVWSCLSSMGAVYGLLFFALHLIICLESGSNVDVSDCMILVILMTGIIMVYPEHFLYACGCFILYSAIKLFNCRGALKAAGPQIGKMLMALIVSIVLSMLPTISETLSFVYRQMNFALGSVNRTYGWQTLFLNYMKGLTEPPAGVLRLLNYIPGLCGLYYLTPNYHLSIWLVLIELIIIMVINIFVILFFANVVKKAVSRDNTYIFNVLLLCICEFIPVIIFWFWSRLWNAGRAIQYSSGVFFVVLLSGILYNEWGNNARLMRMVSTGFVALFCVFYLLKTYDALIGKGTALRENYISIYHNSDNYERDIDFEEMEKCDIYLIDADESQQEDHFYIWYNKLYLTYIDKSFVSEYPISNAQTEELNGLYVEKECDGLLSLRQNSFGRQEAFYSEMQ